MAWVQSHLESRWELRRMMLPVILRRLNPDTQVNNKIKSFSQVTQGCNDNTAFAFSQRHTELSSGNCKEVWDKWLCEDITWQKTFLARNKGPKYVHQVSCKNVHACHWYEQNISCRKWFRVVFVICTFRQSDRR